MNNWTSKSGCGCATRFVERLTLYATDTSLATAKRVLFFSLCVFCFLTSFCYAETSSEQPLFLLSQESTGAQDNSPTNQLSQQLWQARIANPKDKNSNESKSELYQIIEKIRSVKFEPQDKPSEPLIIAEPTQKTEPDDASSDAAVPRETEHKKVEAEPKKLPGSKDESQLPYKPVTDETLQMLKELPQHSEQLKNPVELADILFRSGHLKEAAKCYQEALNRINVDKDDRHKDRAWVLFQIGNCLRNDDPPAAIEMYKRLIAEYPDLLWADLAKTLSNLINWYQQDKPLDLISENRS